MNAQLWQVRAALRQMGLFDAVDNVFCNIPAPSPLLDAWTEAHSITIANSGPLMTYIVNQGMLTDEQVVAVFQEAATFMA